MSGYDFSGFKTDPPKGMTVMEASKRWLWLKRERKEDHFRTREDFLVVKEKDMFCLYRSGPYDDKTKQIDAFIRDENAILQTTSLNTILVALGYRSQQRPR